MEANMLTQLTKVSPSCMAYRLLLSIIQMSPFITLLNISKCQFSPQGV